jgi:hypothetical protein
MKYELRYHNFLLIAVVYIFPLIDVSRETERYSGG